VFDFDIEAAFTEFTTNLNIILKDNFQAKRMAFQTKNPELLVFSRIEIPNTIFCVVLSFAASGLAGLLFFPAFRLARSHHEMKKYTPQAYQSILSYVSFILPIFILIFWIPALFRDWIVPKYFSIEGFETFRFYMILLICLLRLILLRPYMRSFLATSVGWAELLLSDTNSNERGFNIKYKIIGIYQYLIVAAVQILSPNLLLLIFALILKLKGMASYQILGSLCDPSQFKMFLDYQPPSPLPNLFSKTFYHEIFSFLVWWFIFVWSSVACFALLYERNQSIFQLKGTFDEDDDERENIDTIR